MAGTPINSGPSDRIGALKRKTLGQERFLSLEQARIITRVYRENEDLPVILKRSKALAQSLYEIPIAIDPQELIVGNRTPDARAGVVFPEAGIAWLSGELDSLSSRPQDPFQVREADKQVFRGEIEPYWKGKTLEDDIYGTYGEELKAIQKIVKINQKDHAQGHICPNAETWLTLGPTGLLESTRRFLDQAEGEQKMFYQAAAEVLEASAGFMMRYARLAAEMAGSAEMKGSALVTGNAENLAEISIICKDLSERPPETFREALQSLWFLFVILQMESNASSFSPGRADQYLYPYLKRDLDLGIIRMEEALELLDALFLKFNQIVYMRNAHSARYFAGFPIGFNVTIGGQTKSGKDSTNPLSYLMLKAQDHIGMPQPNLTARLHRNSPAEFIRECSRVIGLGSGMPQIVNDESIVPALVGAGLEKEDAMDYVLVGCVELSPQGNYLGWSDAAMFNLVKAMELALNDGKCLISGQQLGPGTGSLEEFDSYEDLEESFRRQVDHFTRRMIRACELVEQKHQEHLPSAFLSAVVDDCLPDGKDVTRGGARYNYSGIQAIQPANIADSLAVIKKLVFDENKVGKEDLLSALRADFHGYENLRYQCLNEVPKYGNDVEWVDELGARWIGYINGLLENYRNFRGGIYQLGMYTVSAHVPMGMNVGATPDGRRAGQPLADGGLSPVYGRDKSGPTAVLHSVSRMHSGLASNGTLLNMKFLPSFFSSGPELEKFASFLKGFVRLPIHHVQFNVITKEDLLNAKNEPDKYRHLTVRVAGYTAYFTELAEDMQDEIIARTSFGGIS